MDRPFSPAAYQAYLRQPPSLKTLIATYPEVWQETSRDLASLAGDLGANLQHYVATAQAQHDRIVASGFNSQVLATAFPKVLKARMLTLALQQYNLAARTKTTGRIAFDDRNGRRLQKLFFDGPGLTRKAVNLWAYYWIWPRITQQAFLLPLVQKKGIYCFYARPLITALAKLTAGRPSLEIAAGDGTLSRLLRQAGSRIQATDDHSWSEVIDYPAEVEKLDAAAALKKYQPEVVICSWPAPGNPFEAAVFATASVQTYIVLGSDAASTGNPALYQAQTDFQAEPRPAWARWLLPQTPTNSVWIMTRRTGSPGLTK